MKVTKATLDDIGRLQQFRRDAAAWLTARGSDQWSTSYPEGLLRASIKAGDVFLFYADERDPVATVTLDTNADPILWQPEEIREPALYVHKLTLADPGGGNGLGSQILDWCGDRAAKADALWLRLDAWTTSTGLHTYYRSQGFSHLRTVHDERAYRSGWVAQRPAEFRDVGFDGPEE
ncbi:GNAT family N-acetyltransferase [Streptomyces sp. NPDC047049]|uniref:GNAT family N-acetyltransferase n=1 Tax=Streptomyces sp. NPDC047049 TaxID=3156688 RepID=UPI0033E4C3D6